MSKPAALHPSIPVMVLAMAVAMAATIGCTKLRQGSKDEEPAVPLKPVDATPLEAQKSTLGIIELKVELRSDGMLLRVANVPAGADISCNMEDKPLVPCHDNALFERPADGEHKITAIAVKDGAPVAYGESAPFTVLPGTGGGSGGESGHPLALVVDDAGFKSGMPLPRTTDFTAKFKFAAAPSCKAEVSCKYGSLTSSFWTECNADGQSFTVKKELMALGLQYLSMRAKCGDDYGPTLSIYWYGVPDGYQPLMLQAVADQSGRQVVELVRDVDCVEGQESKFECAASGATEFDRCDGNVFDAPPSGYRVRMNCAGVAGPELVLKP